MSSSFPKLQLANCHVYKYEDESHTHKCIPIIKITMKVLQCTRKVIVVQVIQIAQVVNLQWENEQECFGS